LVKALEHARHLGATRITAFSDSQLMVKQMNGEYRVKNEGLLPFYQQAVQIRKGFACAAIRHVRREHNRHADRLCNEAMDRPGDHPPFPLPLPPHAPTTAPAPEIPERKVLIDDVREQAVAILSSSAHR
jgi:ribonuclease HI